MTKTTKIVLAVSAALLIAMLGAYLWIEYGGASDDSDQGLTVEEQSPVIHDSGAADSADSSAETEASADAPDQFSTQLQEGIQEIIDYVAKVNAQFPKMDSFEEITLASVEGLAELDAQLRQQGVEMEERREKLLTKYLYNSMDNTGSMIVGFASMAQLEGGFNPERMAELPQILHSIGEPPKKLTNLLMGDMTETQLIQKMLTIPEYRAKVEAAMPKKRPSLQGLDLESLDLSGPIEDPPRR